MPRTARRRRRRRSSPTPSWRSAAIISTAFPIPKIKADPERAREMFSYAASYFGNADAQYDLARLYLKAPAPRGTISAMARAGSALPPRRASTRRRRMLGQMLFNGDQLPRQAARGLMWLTLARDSAAPDETWIKESYNKAIAKASDDDRAHGAADARALGAGPQGLSPPGCAAWHERGLRPPRDRDPTHTGTWSDGFSQARTCLSMPTSISRSAGLRRQQQMVDPDAPVLLPGAGLIIPEGVLARRVGDRAQRVGQAEAEQRLEALAGLRAGTARRWPRRPDCGRPPAAGMTLKSPARISGSSALSRSLRILKKPRHPFEFVGIFLGVRPGCRWADRGRRPAPRRVFSDTTPSRKRAWSSSSSPARPGLVSSNGSFDSSATPLKVFWPWVTTL